MTSLSPSAAAKAGPGVPPLGLLRSSRPATPNEARYLTAEQAGPQHYHVPYAFQIRGQLDVPRLKRTLAAVIASQSSLCSRFDRDGDGVWHRHPAPPPRQPLIDQVLPGAKLDQVRAIIEHHALAAVDFTPATMQYYWLFEVRPAEYWFGFSQHHSISDGMSAGVFVTDLAAAYAADAALPVRADPGEFAPVDWPRDSAVVADLGYWRQRLADVSPPPAYLQDKGNSPADDDPLAQSAHVYRQVDGEERARVREAAAVLGVSEFSLLTTATAVMAARATGIPDLLASFQSNGRHRVEAAAGVIGSFSNAIMVPVHVDEQASARALATAVAADIRAGLRHQAAPFHEVMRHTGRRARLAVNMFPPLPRVAIPGLEVGPIEILGQHFDFELNFRFVGREDALEIILYYRSSLVSEAMARLATFRVIDLALALAVAPDVPLAQVATPQPPLVDVPDSMAHRPVHAYFLAQAAATPDRVAIESVDGTMTYGALDAASAVLARAIAATAAPGAVVAIAAERGAPLIIAMLAALRAGTPFAVFDAGYGEDRWRVMAGIVAPALVIDTLPGEPGRAAAFSASLGLLCLSVDTPDDSTVPLPPIDPAAAAYMLFTSGTTGVPRCIVNWHGPLVHFIEWQQRRFDLVPDDRFSQFSGLGHDPLLRDVFAPLSIGACLAIPPQQLFTQPRGLSRWLAAHRITVAHLTPPVGRLLVDGADDDALGSLRLLFWGGDQMRATLANRVQEMAPAAIQVNVYGSTETPQVIAYEELTTPLPERNRVAIGTSVPGFSLAVVAPGERRCAAAETGEIVVESPWLSLEVRDRDGERIPPGGSYKTGDIAWRLADGRLVLRGRGDDQIKLRGYRVRLADVQAALETAPGIDAAALVVTGTEGEHQLHAFIVVVSGGPFDPDGLRQKLARSLTPGHVPATITRLDALPLLPNGKIDRAALIGQLDAAAPANDKAVGGLEGALLADLSGLLGRTISDPDLSFAVMGGDSLSVVQAELLLQERLGELPQGWEMLSIRQLAASERKAASWGRVVAGSDILRALGILSVVAFHYKVWPQGGAGTAALLLVSGLLFGRLPLNAAIASGTAQPVVRMALRLLAPAVFFGILAWGLKWLDGDNPSLAQHLFAAPFIDYSGVIGEIGQSPYTMLLWFIQALLYILFFSAGLLAVWLRRCPRGSLEGFQFGAVLFALGCVGRFVLPNLFPAGWWGFSPFAHLGTFGLGVMIAFASGRRRWIVMAPLAAYALAIGLDRLVLTGAMVVGVGGLLIIGWQVRLPKRLAGGIQQISGNSLFIYLSHALVYAGMLRYAPAFDGAVVLVMAMIVGIFVGTLWRAVERRVFGQAGGEL